MVQVEVVGPVEQGQVEQEEVEEVVVEQVGVEQVVRFWAASAVWLQKCLLQL